MKIWNVNQGTVFQLGGYVCWSSWYISMEIHVKTLQAGCLAQWFACLPVMQQTLFEPRHDKTNKISVRLEMTQISLGIRPVWSVFAVCMKKPWALRCPGWSESSLGAHSFCWFCHVVAHLIPRTDRFFRAIRPGNRHPASPELENGVSGWMMVICNVTECQQRCPSYQTGKLYNNMQSGIHHSVQLCHNVIPWDQRGCKVSQTEQMSKHSSLFKDQMTKF